MKSSGFLYRLKQKWRYYSSNVPLERKVAEINRTRLQVVLDNESFRVIGCNLSFNIKHHSFIIDRFNLFLRLQINPDIQFRLVDSYLILAFGDISLRVTTAEELFIFYEVFIEGCYNIIVKEEFNVIDVGMNVGIASLYFASNPNINHIFAYEPFTPTFRDAQFNFDLNPHLSSKITSSNYGLGAKKEILALPYSSTLKGKNSISASKPGDQTIELMRADEVFDSLINKNSDKKYFVKMDCEGAEFQIFEEFEKITIPIHIFGFIIEWHRRDPKPIVDVLVFNNFKVHKTGANGIGLITAFR